MNIRSWSAVLATLLFMLFVPCLGCAEDSSSALEKAMSDTLDTWRDGKYELLYEQLAHRGKTSREAFVNKMQQSTIRPACCWQKMENFKVLNEKRTEATVYVKIGLEGATSGATTREYKLTHMEGVWKMQLADVFSIAGITGKKSAKRHVKKIILKAQ